MLNENILCEFWTSTKEVLYLKYGFAIYASQTEIKKLTLFLNLFLHNVVWKKYLQCNDGFLILIDLETWILGKTVFHAV